MNYSYKQAIILRKDLKMGCGKACAHAAHASIEAVWESEPIVTQMWESAGYHKVVLAIGSEQELLDLYKAAQNEGLPSVLIRDFGLTQLEPDTPTAVAIGPAEVARVDKLTGHLKLY